ncbi:MAG: hypothetical protein ACR2ND_14405 [Solirubrobacteraceae bacterium]
MTEHGHSQTERCTICATTTGRFERHHIALRANHPGATVTLCRDCHAAQTERQYDAGLINRRSTSPSDPALALLHPLTEGIAGIFAAVFAAQARHADAADLGMRNECSRRLTLRLLAVTSPDRPGALGPRPILNDRRHRRRQELVTPVPSVDELLEALAAVYPALAAAITGTLPGSVELLEGFTVEDAARLLSPSGARRLARNLATLHAHPRAGELEGIIERDFNAALATVAQLTTATMADALGEPTEIDFEQLVGTVRGFYALAEHWIELMSALASTAQPANAHAAFERFLHRRAPASTDRPAA